MINPSPRRFRRAREPRTRWLPTHQKRAGLGCWAANRSFTARPASRLGSGPIPYPAELAGFAAAVADLIRGWSPILHPGTINTVPPQGASTPGRFAALHALPKAPDERP